MREILFKAKAIDTGKWVEGYFTGGYFAGKHVHYIMVHTLKARYSSHDEYCYQSYQIDPPSLCQWTGLVDKNGVKIFEGDMVINCDDADETGEIFWDDEDACFSAKFENVIFSFSNITEEYMEVIYNIHDKEVEE